MNLPVVIPVFPLPNVVLFPGVPLPLHIFEPRYRLMVADVQASAGIIGMTLLKGNWRDEYYGMPPIFDIGCAGRIVKAERLPDGRSNILLHGIREFTIVREVSSRSYREAEVSWRSVAIGATAGNERDRLGSLLDRLLRDEPENAARKVLGDASLSDEIVVNFLCYALDLSPVEKQGLLESPSLVERTRNLAAMLEFRLDEIRLSGHTAVGTPQFH